MSTFVKICGITRPEDAAWARASGADAIGINFYSQSKRYVADDVLAAEIRAAASGLVVVAVMVNPTDAQIERGLRLADRIQFHGNEPPSLVRAYGERAFKAIAVASAASLDEINQYLGQGDEKAEGHFVLLDAPSATFGGSGKRLDWSLAKVASARYRVVLAGGLTPENIEAAVGTVRPFGVDVASGVESQPGIKDPERVKLFIERAKRT